MAIQCLPEIEFRALNSHQISIQFKYCKMSEFETSHHLHFKESGQKQELSAQNRLFQSKSGQQSQPFYFKTAHFGQRRLVFGHFFYFKLKFTLCFVVKQEVKTMRNFKFTHFAILKFDVSSKPKIQFWEES